MENQNFSQPLLHIHYSIYSLFISIQILLPVRYIYNFDYEVRENTATLVGLWIYWMWQRVHCVSSFCPGLCI